MVNLQHFQMHFLYIPHILLLLTLLTWTSETANILGIFILNSKSHYSIHATILKALAHKGHQVTVMSHFQTTNIQNYTELLLPKQGFPSYIDSISIEEAQQLDGFWSQFNTIKEKELELCLKVIETDFIQELVRANKKPFDLLVVELYASKCFYLLAHKLDVPLVVISPISVQSTLDNYIGNPFNPSYTPLVFDGFTTNMKFFERVTNFIHYTCLLWHQSFVFNKNLEEIAHKYFAMNLPTKIDLDKRIALGLFNNHFSFICKPMTPNAIDIAGIHIQKTKQLPEDIEEFIEQSDQGVILFSFGSTIKMSTLSFEILHTFLGAFAALPQRILWRADHLNITDLPPNVRVGNWFPQRDILEHKKVIAFISHGGLLGVLESIHTATPVIAIPFMFDQLQDANILVEKGVGIRLDYQYLNKNTLMEAINEIINNKKYSENMLKLSQIFKDRPRSPIDNALYWLEYVLKYKGAHHLRTSGADMPLYKYLVLDVIVFFSMLVLSTFYIIKFIISNLIFSRIVNKNDDEKTKRE